MWRGGRQSAMPQGGRRTIFINRGFYGSGLCQATTWLCPDLHPDYIRSIEICAIVRYRHKFNQKDKIMEQYDYYPNVCMNCKYYSFSVCLFNKENCREIWDGLKPICPWGELDGNHKDK